MQVPDSKLKQAAAKAEQLRMQKQDWSDLMVSSLYHHAEAVAGKVVSFDSAAKSSWDQRLDALLTSRRWGYPLMLLLLVIILWITIKGANYPSQLLASVFFWVEGHLTHLFQQLQAPGWLHELVVLGIYRALAWVVSVMLPPMAIFFPLFTLLEDFGYLPRVAFNLDHLFARAGGHGKQVLTMCMGFGCNAAGVIACRIIESPRERLIAILTNNFVPCNGRFPSLIALATIFIGGYFSQVYSSLVAALAVTGIVFLGIAVTLLSSKLFTLTVLKGVSSHFVLELPPYRKPQIGQVLIRSLIDRTAFVLWRAVIVAAPAGAVIWLLANLQLGNTTLLAKVADILNPTAGMMGMDGKILLAFILGMPANEIVIPLTVMGYLSEGAMLEVSSLEALKGLLVSNGWTWLTAVSTMLFFLLHYPCSTTLITIYKETGSWKWTLFSFLYPTAIACLTTFLFTQAVKLLL